MKSDVMGIGTLMNEKEMNELLNETKETLALDAKSDDNNRTFGVVDLWNVQKQHRTTTSRMRRRLN